MTMECTVCRREDVLTHYDTTMDFSFDRRSFLLNTRPVYTDRILKWWWDDEKNKGFIRTSKGREIINRAGCLVRFLLYSQEEKRLAEFRYRLYTEIAERIGDAIRANQHGFVNTLVVCYAVFDSTPFFVDEGIIANVVNAVTELQPGSSFSTPVNVCLSEIETLIWVCRPMDDCICARNRTKAKKTEKTIVFRWPIRKVIDYDKRDVRGRLFKWSVRKCAWKPGRTKWKLIVSEFESL